MSIPGKRFQPGVLFVRNTPGWKGLPRTKHSCLIRTFVTYDRKKFYQHLPQVSVGHVDDDDDDDAETEKEVEGEEEPHNGGDHSDAFERPETDKDEVLQEARAVLLRSIQVRMF